MLTNFTRVRFGLVLIALTSIAAFAQAPSIPHLRKQGTATQLVVGGKPFLIRGGELGNSSASSAEFMKPHWDKLAKLNLNTVLVPFYWELIEPEEGKFDFSLVDQLILDARKSNLKIVPLWFGTWKNSMSCYAPAWVKKDYKRFPRSLAKDGKGMEIMSPFSEENVRADAKAFAALMRHIKEFDGKENTVVMVQVENEIGMIPDSRDRSPIADKLYNGAVPAELMNYLTSNRDRLIPEFREVWAANGFKSAGTWEEVFGAGVKTEEIFMAWHFGLYTNKVTEAGKNEYPLPMFVNAALIRPNYLPGQYPSAGPLPHLIDVWRASATKIDMLSPDVYFPSFADWIRRFHRNGNPLFVPEIQFDQYVGVNALYAAGQHDSIGFSPFSIENGDADENAVLRDAYDLLKQLEPLLVENQGKGKTIGVLAENPVQRQPHRILFNGYALNVTYERPSSVPATAIPASGGLIVALGPDEFLIAGTGFVTVFEPNSAGAPIAGILSADEGRFENGKWIAERRMNGDQTHQGRHIRMDTGRFSIQRVKLYRYE